MRLRAITHAVATVLLVTFQSAPASAQSGSDQSAGHQLVGVWEARLQPDDEKISRMLKRQNVPSFFRLSAARQVSEQLANTIMTMTFFPDGKFQMEQRGAKGNAGRSGGHNHSGTWEIVEDDDNQTVVRMAQNGAPASGGDVSRSAEAGQKTWRFSFHDPDRIASDARDWQDAPFVAPTFVRRMSFRQ